MLFVTCLTRACVVRPKSVQRRFPLQLLIVSIGIALLFAGLFFDMGIVVAQTPVMPTPDRLAQPTLPVSPSQADKGAQVYWLSCLPCHGDRGQGLTEEFKQTYPAEDRNCWNSGCHGKRPYENGFTLPTNIPAVIGAGTLQKFSNAAILHSYIFAAMPYWRPGSLTDEESWQVTAFLLRENNLLTNGEELTASNADLVLVGTPQAIATPQPSTTTSSALFPIPFIVGFIVLLLLIFLLWFFRKNLYN
jgi:mono/diheme cytochrome c family protein